MERQDANAQAYQSDVSAKMLLSGQVPPPEWAHPLTKTLEACTGLPGNHKWVQEFESRHQEDNYPFGGLESPRPEAGSSSSSSQRLKKGNRGRSGSNSYFDSFDDTGNSYSPSKSSYRTRDSLDEPWNREQASKGDQPTTEFFDTKFESDFVSDADMRKHPPIKTSPEVKTNRLIDDSDYHPNSPFNSSNSFDYQRSTPKTDAVSHRRSISAYTPSTSARRGFTNPFASSPSPSLSPSPLGGRGSLDYIEDLDGRGPAISSPSASRRQFKNPFTASPSPKPGTRAGTSSVDYLEDLDGKAPPMRFTPPPPKLTPKIPLAQPLPPEEGVARAIALYDFKAVQVRCQTSIESDVFDLPSNLAWGSVL